VPKFPNPADERKAALAAYEDHRGSRTGFQVNYRGHYESEAAYADALTRAGNTFAAVPRMADFFDVDGWARFLFANDFFSLPAPEAQGGVFVYRRVESPAPPPPPPRSSSPA
jgi:antirestriction protein